MHNSMLADIGHMIHSHVVAREGPRERYDVLAFTTR